MANEPAGYLRPIAEFYFAYLHPNKDPLGENKAEFESFYRDSVLDEKTLCIKDLRGDCPIINVIRHETASNLFESDAYFENIAEHQPDIVRILLAKEWTKQRNWRETEQVLRTGFEKILKLAPRYGTAHELYYEFLSPFLYAQQGWIYSRMSKLYQITPRFIEVNENYEDKPEAQAKAFHAKHLTEYYSSGQNDLTTIIGPAGIGKTISAMIMCDSMYMSYTKNEPNARAPLLIQFSENSPADMEEMIRRHIELMQKEPAGNEIRITKNALLQLWRIGEIVLIFDGYDEMMRGETPVAKKSYAILMNAHATHIHGVKTILTGRDTFIRQTAGHLKLAGDIRNKGTKVTSNMFRVEKFRKYDIENWIEKNPPEKTSSATFVAWAAEFINNPELQELFQTPVYLESLRRMYTYGKRPTNKYEFIKEAAKLMVSRERLKHKELDGAQFDKAYEVFAVGYYRKILEGISVGAIAEWYKELLTEYLGEIESNSAESLASGPFQTVDSPFPHEVFAAYYFARFLLRDITGDRIFPSEKRLLMGWGKNIPEEVFHQLALLIDTELPSLDKRKDVLEAAGNNPLGIVSENIVRGLQLHDYLKKDAYEGKRIEDMEFRPIADSKRRDLSHFSFKNATILNAKFIAVDFDFANFDHALFFSRVVFERCRGTNVKPPREYPPGAELKMAYVDGPNEWLFRGERIKAAINRFFGPKSTPEYTNECKSLDKAFAIMQETFNDSDNFHTREIPESDLLQAFSGYLVLECKLSPRDALSKLPLAREQILKWKEQGQIITKGNELLWVETA
ncbi:MAG: pentapeptide repeat-containing protein [Elusimicrobiota bacterium]|nr:pentapeptide repeat-containing protein [Elusimicrobiota bacterium]